MEPTTVTIPVEELARIIRRVDNQHYWFNLSRTHSSEFHRTITMAFSEIGPSITFGEELNGVLRRQVTHSVRDLFDLLPRLSAFLLAQETQGKIRGY